MDNNNKLDKRYRTIAWGALFILVGTLTIIPGDQTNLAIIGGGIILLGLNLGRSISKIPMNGFTLALGAIVLLSGVVALISSQLGFHFEIELFPIILIAIGVYWLIPERKKEDTCCK